MARRCCTGRPRRCSRRSTSACRSARWSASTPWPAAKACLPLIADGRGERHGAVLHRPRVRAAPLAPTISPEEDARGGGRRVRRRAARARSCCRRAWLPGTAAPLPSSAAGVVLVVGRHHRRPVRVDAEARRRHEGQRHAHSRPRRRARSHRRAAVRRAGVLLVPDASHEAHRDPRLHGLDRHERARRGGRPSRHVRSSGLAAAQNVERHGEAVRRFRPSAVSMATGEALDEPARRGGRRCPRSLASANDGLVEVATHPDVDIVLCASSGTAALDAVLAAIEAGKTIALANKEVLVMAGGPRDGPRARQGRGGAAGGQRAQRDPSVPARAHAPTAVRRLILTASGGPFRGRTRGQLADVTPADALRHPTWQMGPKITIDSATLMNKGLEVIEAHWLFGVPAVADRRRRASAVDRALDGGVQGRLDHRADGHHRHAAADSVRLLRIPDRWAAPVPFLDLARAGALEFHEPAWDDFPCLRLAYPGAARPTAACRSC